MPELIPTSGTRIIDTSLTSYTSGQISTDLDDPVWEWTLTPIGNAPDDVIDSNYTVIVTDVITINYIDKSQLFPISRLDYITDDRQLITITNLKDLPEDPHKSPRITKYVIGNTPYIQWQLDVTVTGTETITTEPDEQGMGGGSTVTEHTLNGSYIVNVVADNNEHINLLRGLLDERNGL